MMHASQNQKIHFLLYVEQNFCLFIVCMAYCYLRSNIARTNDQNQKRGKNCIVCNLSKTFFVFYTNKIINLLRGTLFVFVRYS